MVQFRLLVTGRLRGGSLLPIVGLLLFTSLLAACGDGVTETPSDAPGGGTPDAAPPPPCVIGDAAPPSDADVDDPNNGLFVSPTEFDRAACVPGSLGATDATGIWHTLGGTSFRLKARCDGSYEVYLSNFVGDKLVPALSTPDDVFVRTTRKFKNGAYLLEAFSVCAVNADGTVTVASQTCYDGMCFGTPDIEPALPMVRRPGEAEAAGLVEIGRFSGAASDPWPTDALTANVRVKGDVAYVARTYDGLRLVDITDPAQPAPLGHFNLPDEYMNDVKVVDGPGGARYALLAGHAGAIVVDVTDPTAPLFVGTLGATVGGAHSIFVEQLGAVVRAYLVDGYQPRIDIYDVTNPAAATLLGSYESSLGSQGFHDLYAEGGLVYANNTSHGLLILDATNPASVTQVATEEMSLYSHSNWVTTAGGRKVSVHGDEFFTAHLRIIDVDPASPEYMQTLGEWETRPEVSIHNIMAFGEKVYVAYYQDGIRILDLADPTQPTEVAYFNTWREADGSAAPFEGALGLDVDPATGRIYVADTPHGLLILAEQ